MIYLSIIICTFNRENLLKNCLEALIQQIAPYDQITEVIVVDNNCVDGTSEMMARYSQVFPWMKCCKETRQGLSNARNCGASFAEGQYLCYLDDDAKPGENYLFNVYQMLETFQPDIAGGPVYPYYTSSKPDWFRDEFEIRQHALASGFSTTCSISGGNFIIRANVLSRLGMFPAHLGMVGEKVRLGEEKAVLIRYRHSYPIEAQKVYYSLESYIFHHVPQHKMSISYFWKRGFFSGVSLVHLKGLTIRSLPLIFSSTCRIFFFEFLPLLVKGAHKNLSPILALQQLALNSGKVVEILRITVSRKRKVT
jgi:glucosyl-dolichyl phosphate glucuronosyltransferase